MKRMIICSSFAKMSENVQIVLDQLDVNSIPEPTHVQYTPNGYECSWWDTYKLDNFEQVVGVYHIFDGDISEYKSLMSNTPPGRKEEFWQVHEDQSKLCKKLLREISKQTGIKCKLNRNGNLLIEINDGFDSKASEFAIGLYVDNKFLGYYTRGTSDWSGRTVFFDENIDEAKIYTTSRSVKLAWNNMYGYEEVILYKSNSTITYDEAECEFRVMSL